MDGIVCLPTVGISQIQIKIDEKHEANFTVVAAQSA